MNTVMEITGTQFERGIFELRLERKMPAWMRPFLALGQIAGRFVAIAFFLTSGFLTYKNTLATWALRQGWVATPESALRFQETGIWFLMAVGLIFYGFALLVRQEKLVLGFDKHAGALRFSHLPLFAKAGIREGLIPFGDLKKIELIGPVLHIATTHPQKKYQDFRFRLMTEEQMKFFPLNLSRITGREPTGDWKDPDNEPLQRV